jgi:hypothetical protein
LVSGQVFAHSDGGVVKLLGRVEGDGTKWEVADWFDYWAHEGAEIEPGELRGEPLEDNAEAINKLARY